MKTLPNLNSLKFFGLTYASKLASMPGDPNLGSVTAMGTQLYGSPAEPYVSTWDDDGDVTGYARMRSLASHQFSAVNSQDTAPALGMPYLATLVNENRGVLQSFITCRWDFLATLMCSEPTYGNVRNGLFLHGEDGYHVARFLGSLAPALAASGHSSFDTELNWSEIQQMSLLERAIAAKNPGWAPSKPSKVFPTLPGPGSLTGMTP